MSTAPSLAVIGAGPVGLALALQAATALPDWCISVFDARAADADVSGDPRTLALSLGSIQAFERLGVWRAIAPDSEPIRAVHVSQRQPSPTAAWLGLREPELLLEAADCGVPQFGAVASYGAIVAPLQVAWHAEVARAPRRLAARFGAPVTALKAVPGGVEIDAGIAERHDLAVIAEGGEFGLQAAKPIARDYGQTAWVGRVTLSADASALAGMAFERFTPQGPVALLPLPARDATGGGAQAALVWCVQTSDDGVRALDDAGRLALLATLLPPRAGAPMALSPLKAFALGLNAERTLAQGRTVRIGNAAQTLHPVAGQGLNLGLRDAHALVSALQRGADVEAALARIEWQRAPDRWALIAATDFLARSFTWSWPGMASARGAGLAALQALAPARRALARQMMFGWR